MTEYRIVRNESGRKYRIQQKKETVISLIKHFFRRFILGEKNSHNSKYNWVFVRKEGHPIESKSLFTIKQLVIDLQLNEEDSIFEKWTEV